MSYWKDGHLGDCFQHKIFREAVFLIISQASKTYSTESVKGNEET